MLDRTIPDFEWRGFIDATLAFLGSNPLAFALVVTAAFIFLCEICFAYARETGKRTTEKRASDRAASVDQAQRDLFKAINSVRRDR